MASTIGPARRALWDLLVAEPALGDVQKSFGRPEYPEGKGLALLGVSEPGENFALLGPVAANDEVYGIEVLVWWYNPLASADDRPEVDETAFAIADAVRDVVRANSHLAPGFLWCRVASQRSEGVRRPTADDSSKQPTGWLCLIEMTVACAARAT